MITLTHYLIVAAALFCIGLYGVLAKKNAIAVIMGIEMMLNAVNLNFLAFNRFLYQDVMGSLFVLFIIAVAAAEVAIGLAIIIVLSRKRQSITVDDLDLLKW